MKLANQLYADREFYITELTAILEKLGDATELEKEKRLLDQQLGIDAKAVNDLIAQNARVAQNQAEYQERYDALVKRYEETDAKRTEAMGKIDRLAIRRRKIERFIQSLEEQPDAITEFDASGWAALVSTMTVNSKSDITFQLTSGMEARI